MLVFAQAPFAFDNITDNNTTLVSYDNNSAIYADNVSSDVEDTNNYGSGYYPVDVSNNIDVSKEINNQLKGSGLIFLPNSTGNVVPVQNNNDFKNENKNNLDVEIYDKNQGGDR